MKRVKIVGPTVPVFWPKTPKFTLFTWKKYLWQNIGTFSPFQKGITCFSLKLSTKYFFLLLNFHCLTYSAMVLVPLMLHSAILFSFCISHLFPHQRRCSNLANSPHNGFYWSTICRLLHTLSSFVPLFFTSKSLTTKRDHLDECSTTPPFQHSCALCSQ